MVSLMGMALALAARQGLLALVMLITACVRVDWHMALSEGEGSLLGELTVILLAGLLCFWYRGRA